MKNSELLAFRQHPILPITLEVREDTTAPPHEDMKFSLTLTFRKTSVTKNGVVAKDAEEAAENAAGYGLGFDHVAPQVWDVIPDTFPWSARLKRAMIHLVSLAPSWETLDDWRMTRYTFLGRKDFRKNTLEVPTLDDLEQGDFLLPDEDPIYTEEQVRYVRAYHIVQSVLSFDWATADDQTLRRHPSWLSMEPEDELPSLFDQPDPLDPPGQEPDSLMVNEGENSCEAWRSFFNDAHVSEWRLCWQGQWNGMGGQKVWIVRDSSEDWDGSKYDAYMVTLDWLRGYRKFEVSYPWNEALAWELVQEVAETTSLFEEPPQDMIEAIYGTQIQDFHVRVYQPVVTEWKTELCVPAHTQAEANRIVADLQQAGVGFPQEWVQKERLMVEDVDIMGNIAGNEYWEVSKLVDDDISDDYEEELSVTPDMSGQRAFVWGEEEGVICICQINNRLGLKVMSHCEGVLIAERAGGVLVAKPDIPTIPSRRFTVWRGAVGNEFWCPEDHHVYRILWVFRNPQ